MSMNMNMNQMTSTTVQQAIYENNEGAKLLRQCHYDEASVLQILKPLAIIAEDKQHAARNTRHCSDHDSANANANANASSLFNISFDQTKPTDDTSSSSLRTSLSLQSLPVDASSSLPSTPTSTTYEFPQRQRQQKQRKLKHFVFCDPVIIPPQSIVSLSVATAAATATNIHIEDPPSSFYSPALSSKFRMIIMYNLALTLHLQAIALVSSSTSSSTVSSSNHRQHQTNISNIKQLFKRSRKLYELAFESQLETDVDPVFTLALTNNLGLIYCAVNERKKCLICFRDMFSTMMYLMDSHNSHTTIQSSIKNWDGLLSNAMDILFKHTYEVVAAAA